MKVCGYCRHYAGSEWHVDKDRDIIKECIPSDKEVKFTSRHCSYFHPCSFFFCNAYHERLKLVDCLPRRFNHKNLGKFSQCKDCNQFDEEIKEIINDYYIEKTEINKPPRQHKLKYRRKKKDERSRLKFRRKKNY